MRATVAGAGGMIGGRLVKRLLSQGHEVRAIDKKPSEDWWLSDRDAENISGPFGELSELSACQAAVDRADHVYNLAADMGGIGFIEQRKADCMLSVLISTNMLIAARDAGVQRFFYSSSACAYAADKQDEADAPALREEDAYPAMPEDGYGWEKLFSERMARHFREDFGLETRVARYHNIYGPPTTWTGGREKAPAALCRKVAEAVLSGNHRIVIWGDGEQARSYCWIDDCIEGTLRVMNGEFADPLNVGSSELVTVNQLVDIIESIVGVKLQRFYDHSAPQGVRGRNSDNTLIRSLYDWEPTTSLRDGLGQLYPWVYEQVEAATYQQKLTL